MQIALKWEPSGEKHSQHQRLCWIQLLGQAALTLARVAKGRGFKVVYGMCMLAYSLPV